MSAADISLTRNNLDVIVSIKNTADALVLKYWISNTLGLESVAAIESIQFEGGAASIDAAAIHSLLDNHAPVALATSAAVREDGTGATSTTATGNVLASPNASDIDLPYDSRQHLNLSADSTGVRHGQYGDLTLAADGSYSYVLSNSAANVQALGRSALVTDAFAYTVQDNALDNKTASASLTVTVQGTNDGPVAAADAASVKEDATLTATGNVLTNDTDVDAGDVLTVATPGTLQGTYGSLALGANGAYTYTLNNAAANVQALGRNAVVSDTFAYSATDGLATSASALTVTVTGTNDGPVASVDATSVKEDAILTATGNVLGNDTDVDAGDVLSVVAPGTLQGTYGNLALAANGAYTYTLNNAATNVQSLRGGQKVTDSFAYSATDGLATSASSLTVTVTGTNDAPVAFADVASAKEDTNLAATGNVLANDKDVDAGTVLSVANAGSFTGSFGTLVLAANGSYTYTLANNSLAVQSLAVGQTATDVFAYTAKDDDANPLTGSATLSITVTGVNDAPVLATAIATQAAREGAAFAFTIPVGTFTDVDQGDVLSYKAQSVDAAGNATSLPTWLAFNVATRAFSGTPGSTAGGSFDLLVTATDKAGASATSRFTLNVSDEFATTSGGINSITGNNYNNTLNGTNLNETILGKAGADVLYGGAGDDTLDGGAGADLLFGGDGNDTLQFGADAIWGEHAYVTNAGSPGKAGSNRSLEIEGLRRSLDSFDGGAGTDTLLGTSGNDAIVLDDGVQRIKGIEVIDAGAGNDVVDLTSPSYALGDMLIKGGAGDDVLWSSAGNDVLQGGDGADQLDGGAGAAVLDGGAGDDVLRADTNQAADLLFGGKGADALYAGKGADLIAFNKGDGADSLYLTAEAASTGANDSLSLGGGIKYADLSLKKSGNDLVLSTAASGADSISIKDWYATTSTGTTNKTVNRLQVVTVGGDYNAASTDKTRNQQVEVLDFSKLVAAFDTARATKASNANGWAVMNSLLDAHLQGTSTAALGGDLAYQYATQGSLAGIGLQTAQASLAAGTDWQTLHTRAQVEQGSVKLA